MTWERSKKPARRELSEKQLCRELSRLDCSMTVPGEMSPRIKTQPRDQMSLAVLSQIVQFCQKVSGQMSYWHISLYKGKRQSLALRKTKMYNLQNTVIIYDSSVIYTT